MMGDMTYVTQANLYDVLDPFAHDPMRIFTDDNPDSAYYFSVSSDQSVTPQVGTHGH